MKNKLSVYVVNGMNSISPCNTLYRSSSSFHSTIYIDNGNRDERKVIEFNSDMYKGMLNSIQKLYKMALVEINKVYCKSNKPYHKKPNHVNKDELIALLYDSISKDMAEVLNLDNRREIAAVVDFICDQRGVYDSIGKLVREMTHRWIRESCF